MRKLLLGSVALTFFSFSIILLQISCKKDVIADTLNYILPQATTSVLGGVIVGDGLTVSSNGTLSIKPTSGGTSSKRNKIIFGRSNRADEIWTANYDGTNQTKLNFVLPAGLELDGEGLIKLSPDGETVFFNVKKPGAGAYYIYSCKIDGSQLTKVIDVSSADDQVHLGGVN